MDDRTLPPAGASSGRLLTPADIARRCQVSTKTVLRAIHASELRASRLGVRGAYRIREEDLEAWLSATASRAPRLETRAPGEVALSLPTSPPRHGGRGTLAVPDEMRPR